MAQAIGAPRKTTTANRFLLKIGIYTFIEQQTGWHLTNIIYSAHLDKNGYPNSTISQALVRCLYQFNASLQMSTVSSSSSPTSTPPKPEEADSPIGNLTKAFEFAIRQREFEISQLTQRNNFFMIFQGVLIAGVIQSQGTAAPSITFSVCFIGFATSILQVGMAAGSKFWQIRWERAAKTTEIWLLQELKDYKRVNTFLTADGNFLTSAEKTTLEAVNSTSARTGDPITYADGAISNANKEEINQGVSNWTRKFENFLILRKYSVSRIPIWAAVTLSLFWLFLLLSMVSINGTTLGPITGFFDLDIIPLKKGT